MKAYKLLLGVVLAGAITGAVLTLAQDTSVVQHMARAEGPLGIEGVLPSLRGATGWLNSEALTPTGLRGQVVLVQFWTYSCINWIRTAPYIRALAEKYKDKGLVVIGVHTPEFAFEQNVENIRRAAMGMGIVYPIAIDSDYAIWRAFDNHYWPALYLVDANGRIRHHQFGEGEYEQTERVVRQLLAEAGADGIDGALASVQGKGVEAPADWGNLKSPETYVGYDRTENFSSPGGPVLGNAHVYALPGRLALNQWALAGDWTMGREAAALNQPDGRIAYRFHARDLNLVMGPADPGTTVRFRISMDGQRPGSAHGVDVDDDGIGRLTDQRLYQLIRQPGTVRDRQVEIEFLDAGAQAFVFTFG
jgi:thiol-disulfide isomerase/thioredoxin